MGTRVPPACPVCHKEQMKMDSKVFFRIINFKYDLLLLLITLSSLSRYFPVPFLCIRWLPLRVEIQLHCECALQTNRSSFNTPVILTPSQEDYFCKVSTEYSLKCWCLAYSTCSWVNLFPLCFNICYTQLQGISPLFTSVDFLSPPQESVLG